MTHTYNIGHSHIRIYVEFIFSIIRFKFSNSDALGHSSSFLEAVVRSG